MGTETFLLLLYFSFRLFSVKLNNPQMGTETLCSSVLHNNYKIIRVKLNNPQMGTETPIPMLSLLLAVTAG